MPYILPTKFTRLEKLLERKAQTYLKRILEHGRKEGLADLVECCKDILDPQWESIEDVWGEDMKRWQGTNPSALSSLNYENLMRDLPFEYDFLKENLVNEECRFEINRNDPFLYRIGFFLEDLIIQDFAGEKTPDDKADSAFENVHSLFDLMVMWEHFYQCSQELTPRMYQKLLLAIEADIVMLAGESHQHQHSGGHSMKERAQKRKLEILDKALSIDSEKSMTAYALTLEIGPEFDNWRTVKKSNFSTTSTPKRKSGFSDSNIRKTLKENGWK